MRLSVVLGVIGLLLALLLVDPAARATDLGLFFGRFHPTIVHFPIALLLVVAGIELSAWRGWLTDSFVTRAAPALLFVAVWSAIGAAIAGMFLAQGGGYDLSTFEWHQRLGILTAVVSAFAFVWRSRGKSETESQLGRGYFALIGVVVVLVAVAGHLGGTLTHGEGYLTRFAPDPVRRVLGLAPKATLGTVEFGDPATATVYEALVRPVLVEKCVACHNPKIPRGALSLDSPDAIMEGGEDGPVVVPGRGSDSDIIKRIWLPATDRDHMPPDGRPQVTVAEAEVVRWWIDNGASFEQTIADAEPNAAVEQIFASWGMDDIPSGVFALDVPTPDSSSLRAVRDAGMAVSFVAESQPFVQARCRDTANCMNAQQSAALAVLADQLIWLDLGRSGVTDDQLSVVSGFPHLTRLHLENTRITDASLAYVNGLEYLEYLNVYGTGVTDSGLEVLDSLPALRQIYLWQTRVSKEGAEAFAARWPHVTVTMGVDG